MYDQHLPVFIQVADCGSFLKASEKLYISATAVTKQINLLEQDLGVTLFHRSRQGLRLTEAGALIYEEAKKYIHHSDKILQKAKELEGRQKRTIRLGVSRMNPLDIFLELWNETAHAHPDFHLEIVPYEDTFLSYNHVLERLGKQIDLIALLYQSTYWEDSFCSFHIRDLPLRLTCSPNHRLAKKPLLEISDLYGETLILFKRGLSSALDLLRDMLMQHPEIHIRNIEHCEYSTFNQLLTSEELLVSCDCWANVNPVLVTLPVNWSFALPYGLIYAKDSPPTVLDFISTLHNLAASGKL